MKFKTFFLLQCFTFVVICFFPMLTEANEFNNLNSNYNNNKFALYDLNRKISFLEKNKSGSEVNEFIPKSKYFKGKIKTENYKMNPEDKLSYSNTNEIIQKKFYFDLDIDMKSKKIYGYLRVFYQCNKKAKFFILDFKALQISKIMDHDFNELEFSFIKKTTISKSLGKGLKIELKSECDINQKNFEKNYVDIHYSTTEKSVALHFSHKTMLENENFGFLYSHGAAIFARTLFPCQDTPFAKVQVEGKLRIEKPYTVLFAGKLKSRRDLINFKKIFENNNKNVLEKLTQSKLIDKLNDFRKKNLETINIIKNDQNDVNKKFSSFLENISKIKTINKIKSNKITHENKIKRIANNCNNPDKTEFFFVNEKPISSYLITFAAGYIKRRDFGDKCIVYGEPKILASKKTSASFYDCSKFVEFYDKYIHPNEWGKMIFLIIPDDFPYGGMENPYNIHVTKSTLTNDGSLRNVIAHEIAHFWSGNLVTNRNWEHFWLNEGFTNYLYRKCYQKLFGEEEFMKELDRSQKRLAIFFRNEAYLEKIRKEKTKLNDNKLNKKNSIKQIKTKIKIQNKISNIKNKIINKNKNDNDDDDDYENFNLKNNDKSHLTLWPKIKRSDPYNNFSLIPYEKGFSFLYYLETKFGEKFVFELLRAYFSKFKYSSATTNDFINLLKQHIIKEKGEAQKDKIYKEIDFNKWIYGTKNIPVTFKIKSKILGELKSFIRKIEDEKITLEDALTKILKYNTYYINYILSLLNGVYVRISDKKLPEFEKKLHFFISRLFNLQKKGLLEDSTKSKLIIMKATLMYDKEKKKRFLTKTLVEFKFYHISYLKKIISMLKYECDMKNPEILKIIEKVKDRFNKLAILRIMQFIYKN